MKNLFSLCMIFLMSIFVNFFCFSTKYDVKVYGMEQGTIVNCGHDNQEYTLETPMDNRRKTAKLDLCYSCAFKSLFSILQNDLNLDKEIYLQTKIIKSKTGEPIILYPATKDLPYLLQVYGKTTCYTTNDPLEVCIMDIKGTAEITSCYHKGCPNEGKNIYCVNGDSKMFCYGVSAPSSYCDQNGHTRVTRITKKHAVNR